MIYVFLSYILRSYVYAIFHLIAIQELKTHNDLIDVLSGIGIMRASITLWMAWFEINNRLVLFLWNILEHSPKQAI